ncbi:Ctr copper transporter family-domain-containing protein [Aspergillus californicus]
MDMEMDMDMSNTSSHEHNNISHTTPNTNMNMNMPAIFTSSTKVTLFFKAWTTTSPAAYILTLLLLFALAFLNRFLAALRFQLQSSHPPETPSIPILAAPRRRRAIPKARLSPLPQYMQLNRDSECESAQSLFRPGGPDEYLDSDRSEKPHAPRRLRRFLTAVIPQWTPSAPWSLRGDGGRGLLEGVRAFIGYILMLAVMTFNIGVFCAVILGIIVGETVVGRYMQHSSWLDGACHD